MLYVVGDLGQHRWYCRRLLMALSHHLDQCWLFSRQVLCHSYEGNFRANAQASAGIVPRVWKLHFYISNDLMSSWVMEDVPWWRKSKLQYLVVDVVVSYNRQCPFIVISTAPVDTYHKGPVPRTSDVLFVVFISKAVWNSYQLCYCWRYVQIYYVIWFHYWTMNYSNSQIGLAETCEMRVGI